MDQMRQIGFGGGCHWCTEAIFQTLRGVEKVEQGWIASVCPNDSFSEAVIVYFDPQQIDLKALINIHLHTHSCTGKHSMRNKYRSAVYTYSKRQESEVEAILNRFQLEFEGKIITQVLPLHAFQLNDEHYLNYYYNNPEKPFCKTYINPKLKVLLDKFKNKVRRVRM